MSTPRKRPEIEKPARAREARPKPSRGGPIEVQTKASPRVAPPAGMVSVTRRCGSLSETFTGTVADLRRLGVVKAAKAQS